MSELSPISALPVSNDTEFVEPAHRTKSHLLAAIFSAIVPGAGQFFIGERRNGAALLFVFAAVLIGFWPLRLARFYAGLVLLFAAWFALYLYAACNALFTRKNPVFAHASRWWLVLVIPFTLGTLSLLGAAITRASGFRSFSTPSTSMEKTLRQGDAFVVDTTYRRVGRRDVIAFLKDRTYMVKRVIAIGGDSIEGKNQAVLVNGTQQDEPYIEHIGGRGGQEDWMNNFAPITIPKGKVFVMGDNRDVSLDSRSTVLGLVDEASIVGKVLYVFKSDRPGTKIQ